MGDSFSYHSENNQEYLREVEIEEDRAKLRKLENEVIPSLERKLKHCRS